MLRYRFLLLLFLCCKGIAQKNDAPLPLDPALRTGKLPNGLTYYIRKNMEPRNRAELRLVVNAGSILETDRQAGLAHFVEHMSFNGTEHFKKNELVNFLEKSGVSFGADLNASTSFDETVYELQVPTDSPAVYRQAMQILEDWAHGVSFEPGEIDKERGVIVEEWRLGLGADARLRDKYFPVLLKGSRYAHRLPIGTKQNIDTAHYQEITSFYKDWYRPDLEAVIVVGDVDVEETERMIRDHFGRIPLPAHPKPRIKYTVPSHADTRTAILTDPEQRYNVVQVYYTQQEAPPITTEQGFRTDMVRELFNQMMSSRLEELGQKPEAPFLFANSSYGDFIGDKDAFTLLAVAKTGKQVNASMLALLTENERVRQYGFSQTELDRAVKNILSRVENAYNERDKTKSAELVQKLVTNYLKGEAVPGIAYEYEAYRRLLSGIRLAEVNNLVKQWTRPGDRAVVITAPASEKATLPTQAAVIASLNRPIGKLKNYADKFSTEPLLPVEPVAGTITSEKKFDALGTVEWTLSNGARVVLKPTTFKNDEIEFSAVSWGGSSLYSDNEYLNAANAALITSSGGMGHMDIQAMQKALSGRNCYVVPSISSTMQGVNGGSSVKDLATAMELLYGSFVFPRKDPSMFDVVLQQFRAQLENKDKDPSSVFGDTVSYTMGNYHFRRKPMSLADLNRLNLDRAYTIYRERFSNAGQFLFTFVGSFSTDSIRPLVEKYIASLPGSPARETFRDVGIRYPEGVITKVIRKGKEKQARVNMFFTGNDVAYNDMDDLQLSQLCKTLAIRLRELLREDAGGVYGVSVGGGLGREPSPSYSVAISFGCAPENVDKLVKMTLDEIDRVKKEGMDQVNIDKIVAEQTRALETSVKENSYWRFQLEQAFFRHTDPMKILDAKNRIRQLTKERTKELAGRFFNANNFAKFVLLPE